MKLKNTLLTFSLLISALAFSQEVSNIHFEQVGNQIHIYYDLEGNQDYTVKVFCSTDNGKNWGKSLKQVTAAIGKNQTPGNNKMIVWDVLTEQERLSGEVRFKIEVINVGSFTDTRDGQTYKWVKIGKQVWMAENLNYKIEDSYCYENKPANCLIYGRLYDGWDAKTVCPNGWHLPNIEEWEILKNYLDDRAGGKMKEKGESHWKHPNAGATNSSGFTALPGGMQYSGFEKLGSRGYWWSSTDGFETNSKRCRIIFSNDKLGFGPFSKSCDLSVRCLRDFIGYNKNKAIINQ